MNRMNRCFLTFSLLLHVSYRISAIPALDEQSYVSFQNQPGYFELVNQNKSASLIVSANDFKGVQRAVDDLKNDLARVTSVTPIVANAIPRNAKNIVIIGTLGHSEWIQHLVDKKLIAIEKLKGKWESYAIITLKKPFKGVEQALVIVGSDKRGTIYGVYNLSSNIGVSPWYWWADMPVVQHDQIFIKPMQYYSDEPKVKYRGIFINDEAPALLGWVKEKFGGFNHRFYTKVFELILRLRGNYLWPAM